MALHHNIVKEKNYKTCQKMVKQTLFRELTTIGFCSSDERSGSIPNTIK